MAASAQLPGSTRVSRAEVALLASVFVVAACGLVYELAAGTLASNLAEPMADRIGAAPSWDSVLYEADPGSAGFSASLGYVDAMHRPPGRTPGRRC